MTVRLVSAVLVAGLIGEFLDRRLVLRLLPVMGEERVTRFQMLSAMNPIRFQRHEFGRDLAFLTGQSP